MVVITSEPWHRRSDTTSVLEMLGTTWRATHVSSLETVFFFKKPHLKLDFSDSQIRVEVWSENPRQV